MGRSGEATSVSELGSESRRPSLVSATIVPLLSVATDHAQNHRYLQRPTAIC